MEELYKASNVNNCILYNIGGTVKLTFQTSGGNTIEKTLQVIYTLFNPVNLISIGQLKKDGIEYNKRKDCFIVEKNDQDIIIIIWIINVLVLSV